MNQTGGFVEKWNAKYESIKPTVDKIGSVAGKICKVIYVIGLWIYRFRSAFFAIPVVYAALKLARVNYELLPEMVGLNLLTNGEYSYMVSRDAAVYAPLLITAACLLMMILSRKTLYPWVISVFSLAIPLLILITNVFPA